MNGDSPYTDAPGVTEAGQALADQELTVDQVDALRQAVASIISRTGSYLPEGFAADSELSAGTNRPLVAVAIRPPVSRPVNTGFSPDADDLNAGLTDEDRNEATRELTVSAAFQVISAVGSDLTPAAR